MSVSLYLRKFISMTKQIICFILLVCSTFSLAQNVSDFKYVIIPEKFSEFDKNEYRINYHLMRLLGEKKYEILNANPSEWPEEVQKNSCLALNSDILKGKKFLKNKVELVFTDCQGNEIERLEGISNEKSYAVGYPDALKNAVQSLRISFPKELDYQPKTTTIPTVPTPEIKTQGNISENSWIDSGIEFQNDGQSIILTEQKDGSFILIDKNTSSIFAQLKPSSKKSVYHVTISDPSGNYHTIGFYEDQNLTIEFKSKDNQFSAKSYKRKP